MQYKKQPNVAGNFDNIAICTYTNKTFKQVFSSLRDTFIWWLVDCSACGLHKTKLKIRDNTKKKSASSF